jgi:hypothetical protein
MERERERGRRREGGSDSERAREGVSERASRATSTVSFRLSTKACVKALTKQR